jgi:hypothetical protein
MSVQANHLIGKRYADAVGGRCKGRGFGRRGTDLPALFFAQ